MPEDKIDPHIKLNNLKRNLKELGSVAVAFSGGADSAFLLKVARDVLRCNSAAVTARSESFPERELQQAKEFAKKIEANHVIIDTGELDDEEFLENPVNRCYLCKKGIYSKILEYARANGLRHVVDGSTVDDVGDFRPGLRAIEELGIKRPLMSVGMGKMDVRVLSREMGLPTWDKPSFACLVSRFPYGTAITRKGLAIIDELERFLLDRGFRQVRVRHHGTIARIEVEENERSKFFDAGLMDKVHEKFSSCGFVYTALDLKGYRTGSMNETIKKGKRKK